MDVRKWIKILHRDIGYLCVGLTIIYSVSGIAVNHINDWNPNYIIEQETLSINPVTDSTFTDKAMIEYVITELNETDSVNSYFRSGPVSIQIFMEQKTISANLKSGEIQLEKVSTRPVFRETNFLHLNNPKKVWTYVADLFAGCLILLAITGMFMLKKSKGLAGRGKYFVGAGILIPIIFLLIYF